MYLNRELLQQQQRLSWKRPFKNEFMLLQILSCLFHLFQFIKCWQILLEFHYKKTVSKFRKRKRKLSCVHVLHKTWNWALSCRSHTCTVTAKKWTEKSVMHVQRKPKPIACWCSRCRRHRHCSSSLKTVYKALSYIVYLTKCTFRRHISWRRWTIKSISQPVWRFNIKRTPLKSSWLALLITLTNKMHCVPLGFCFVRVRCRRIPLWFGSSLRRAFRIVNTICKFPRHCIKLKTKKNMIILSVNHLILLQVRSLGWCP